MDMKLEMSGPLLIRSLMVFLFALSKVSPAGQEDGALLFSVIPGVMKRGIRHKLEHKRFCLNFFTVWSDTAPEQFSQRSCGFSLFGDIQKPSEHALS